VLTAGALSGVSLLGDMLKIQNPLLKIAIMAPLNILAQNIGGMAIGAKGYSLKDVFGAKLVPNLAAEMAKTGVKYFAIQAGADPFLASVISAPIGAAAKLAFSTGDYGIMSLSNKPLKAGISAALPYGEDALVDKGASPLWAGVAARTANGILVKGDALAASSFTTYLFQELASEGMAYFSNYLIKDKGYSPFKASLIELSVAGALQGLLKGNIAGGISDTYLKSANNLFTFGYEKNMSPYELTNYIRRLQNFTEKTEDKGLLPALEQRATTSLRLSAYNSFQSSAGDMGDYLGNYLWNLGSSFTQLNESNSTLSSTSTSTLTSTSSSTLTSTSAFAKTGVVLSANSPAQGSAGYQPNAQLSSYSYLPYYPIAETLPGTKTQSQMPFLSLSTSPLLLPYYLGYNVGSALAAETIQEGKEFLGVADLKPRLSSIDTATKTLKVDPTLNYANISGAPLLGTLDVLTLLRFGNIRWDISSEETAKALNGLKDSVSTGKLKGISISGINTNGKDLDELTKRMAVNVSVPFGMTNSAGISSVIHSDLKLGKWIITSPQEGRIAVEGWIDKMGYGRDNVLIVDVAGDLPYRPVDLVRLNAADIMNPANIANPVNIIATNIQNLINNNAYRDYSANPNNKYTYMRIESGPDIGSNSFRDHTVAVKGALDTNARYEVRVNGKLLQGVTLQEAYEKFLRGEKL